VWTDEPLCCHPRVAPKTLTVLCGGKRCTSTWTQCDTALNDDGNCVRKWCSATVCAEPVCPPEPPVMKTRYVRRGSERCVKAWWACGKWLSRGVCTWKGCDVVRCQPPCETRQDTWRIKRTREGQRLTGKAPPKTMGETTEGTRDVDGCDDGVKGREGSQGKRLSLELRLPPRSPRRSSVRLTIYSPWGTYGAPEHACARLHTVRHQKGQKQRETGVCRQNAAPNGPETQVKKRGEAGGFRHKSREQRALPIG